MARMQKTASLDEGTVQKVARGEHEIPRQRRRSSSGQQVLATSQVTVHRDVWRMVKENSLNPRHIQILSEHEVIVWNHPAPWPEVG